MDKSLAEHIFPSPRIFWVTRLLCGVVLFLTFISMVIPKEHKEIFVWIMFIAPVLWVLIFTCAVFNLGARKPYRLLILWVLVNLVIIVFLASFSDFNNWKQARDGDVLLMTLYFPVVFPIWLIQSILPSDYEKLIGHSIDMIAQILGNKGSAYFLSIWLHLALLSTLEIFFLTRLAKFFNMHRDKKRITT